jgi:CO/xanthine dehydrogenase Mo-binding subunit
VKHVSTSHRILDGYEKVTGRLAYVGDMQIDGLLQGRLLFSPIAHARIRAIDVARAQAVPGVAAVFHHGNTSDGRYDSSMWLEGQQSLEDERMFPPVVRFVGDRVAAVVAETAEIAEHAVGLIDVEYESMPAIFEPEAALARSGALTDENGEPTFNNPIIDVNFSYGDPTGDFDAAHLVVEDTIATPKTHHCAIENHACIAVPQQDGRILVLSPCQSIFSVQYVVAKALKIAPSEIRAIKTPIGGSFGGKAEPILEPLCAFFARALQRPVKIEFDRTETFTSTRMRSRAVGRIRTAVDRAGRIMARDTEVIVDVGAYSTGGEYLPASMSQRLCRLYRVDSQRFRGRAVYTNTPTTGAFRGYGSPQIHAISEINIDNVARRLGMDPVAFRLRNLVEPHAVDPVSGLALGNARIRDCALEGAARFGWAEKWRRPRSRGRFRRGAGMACATHINGCYPGYHEAATVGLRLGADGAVNLSCAVHDLGCGSNTVLAQIVAEVLDVPPASVVISAADTDVCGYDLGTRASRMTYVCGEAARRAAERLCERVRKEAALVLNCAALDVVLEEAHARSSYGSQRSMPLGALAAHVQRVTGTALEETETFAAVANPGSYAAHFAEVEVDSLTGRVRVIEMLASHDLGRAINPRLVEGQIHGGIQIGIGFALFEDVDVCPSTGRVWADSFARYPVVNAPEMPPVQVVLVDGHESTGPFGAKAVGEIATIPVAPAVVNAVNHALGARITDLPVTPERVLEALRDAR